MTVPELARRARLAGGFASVGCAFIGFAFGCAFVGFAFGFVCGFASGFVRGFADGFSANAAGLAGPTYGELTWPWLLPQLPARAAVGAEGGPGLEGPTRGEETWPWLSPELPALAAVGAERAPGLETSSEGSNLHFAKIKIMTSLTSSNEVVLKALPAMSNRSGSDISATTSAHSLSPMKMPCKLMASRPRSARARCPSQTTSCGSKHGQQSSAFLVRDCDRLTTSLRESGNLHPTWSSMSFKRSGNNPYDGNVKMSWRKSMATHYTACMIYCLTMASLLHP